MLATSVYHFLECTSQTQQGFKFKTGMTTQSKQESEIYLNNNQKLKTL